MMNEFKNESLVNERDKKEKQDKILFIFDLDGTLIDSFNFFKKFGEQVMKKYDIHYEPETFTELQKELIEMTSGKSSKFLIVKLINHSSKKLGLGPFRRFSFFLDLKKIYKEHVNEVMLFDGVEITFKAIKDRGDAIAILTTSSRKEFSDRMNNKQFILNLVDAEVVRNDVKNLKPDPEGIFLLMEKIGIKNAARIIMVGDMVHDIYAGRNAGGISIGVTTGINTREELLSAGATRVIDSITELLDVVAEITPPS